MQWTVFLSRPSGIGQRTGGNAAGTRRAQSAHQIRERETDDFRRDAKSMVPVLRPLFHLDELKETFDVVACDPRGVSQAGESDGQSDDRRLLWTIGQERDETVQPAGNGATNAYSSSLASVG